MANYDPEDIIINFKGFVLQGFAAGTFVSVEREVDSFTKSTGAGGNVTRVRSRNKSGTITLTLQAESPSNGVLAASLAADELVGGGEGPVFVTNLNGVSEASGAEAWVRKTAKLEHADTASNREWMIDVADLAMFVGGALDA